VAYAVQYLAHGEGSAAPAGRDRNRRIPNL